MSMFGFSSLCRISSPLDLYPHDCHAREAWMLPLVEASLSQCSGHRGGVSAILAATLPPIVFHAVVLDDSACNSSTCADSANI